MQGGPPGRGEGRPGALLLTLAGLLLLALLGGGLWLVGSRPGPVAGGATPAATPVPSRPPTATVDSSVLRLQALDELLAARSTAVLTRDEAAWLATVDPASPAFVRRQVEVFANLRDVPLAGWRYEYAGEGPSLPVDRVAELGPGAWVARVVLVYRLDAGDPLGEVRREHNLTLVPRDEGWLVADDADGRTAPDLWDLGPVQVVRGARSLVLGNGEQDLLQRLAGEADAAAVAVDAVWGTDWPRTVVVMAPRSQADMARVLLREDEAGLDQIAAVTTGEVGADEDAASADRVIVNPAGFAQLGPVGRRVVLTHEITHVATRATTRTDVPIWLSEGFADHVAYREAGVAVEVVAQDVLDQVRAGDGPTRLPQQEDFDPSRGVVAPAYSGAWLAAELVAGRWGQDALVELHRAVASGVPADAALVRVTGLDTAGFTQQWLAHLEQLAS